MYLAPVQSLPIKPCRQRRHFSPQMRVSRFVFLSRPPLSLGVHLGVTASPQTPFPVDYVTVHKSCTSPPLRLTRPRHRARA